MELREMIMRTDDKAKFVSMVKGDTLPGETFRKTIRCGAIKCATAMLEGETGHSRNRVLSHDELSPLSHAAKSLRPNMTELLLRYGLPANLREYRGYGKDDGFLWRFFLPWTPEESILELLILFCMPNTKPALDTIRLLERHTTEIEDVVYKCAKQFNTVTLGALLLVIQCKDVSASEGCLGLQQCILSVRKLVLAEIGIVTFQESKITGRKKSSALDQMCKDYERKKKWLISMWLLLEVFEKAGDAFKAYLQESQRYLERREAKWGRMRHPESGKREKEYWAEQEAAKKEVAEEVVQLLKGINFNLKSNDIDMTETCRHVDDWLKSLRQQLELMLENRSKDKKQEPERNNSLSANVCMSHNSYQRKFHQKGVCEACGQAEQRRLISTSIRHGSLIPSSFGAAHSFHTFRNSSDNFDFGFPTTTRRSQVKIVVKGTEQYAVNFLPSKQWASFALVVKKWLKSV